MIHGAFCGPWSLEGLQQKFQDAGYAVTAPCLRFHDQAPPPAALGTTGLADYGADLEEEIKHMDAPPIVVGHSMGGLLALQLASRVPVRALILLAPSAPWGIPPTTLFEIGAARPCICDPVIGTWCWSPAATWRWPIPWTSFPAICAMPFWIAWCPNPAAPRLRS